MIMFGIRDGDNHIDTTIFNSRENAQHYCDSLNEQIHQCEEFEVVELYVAD